MKEPKRCAYCCEQRVLTREHIVPEFLYRQHPDQRFGLVPQAGRYAFGDWTVRDVCSECNSGVLSSLDQYGRVFFEANRVARTFIKRETISVTYNYQLLLRWLLKVSYNAIRFQGAPSGTLRACAGAILGKSHLPFHAAILLEVLRDQALDDDVEFSTPDCTGVTRRIPARLFRFSGMAVPGKALWRAVGINAFQFYVVLDNSADQLLHAVATLRRWAPQAVQLPQHRERVRVQVSKRTVVDAFRERWEAELPRWMSYLAKGRAVALRRSDAHAK